MATPITPLSLFLSLSLFTFMATPAAVALPDVPSPYLSSAVFARSYEAMARSLRIFIYIPSKAFSFGSPAESLFYTSLLNSPLATQNAEEAHLFFIPFPSDLSTRSIGRLVRGLRTDLPYWNRTLGADHFFLSCAGVDYASDRNVVELKKNAIQVSCFPAAAGKFIPHKDITLPPVADSNPPLPALVNKTERVLGYIGHGWVRESSLMKELIEDPEFLTESEPPSGQSTYAERLANSEFCLFEYGGGDISGIGHALRFGCVPVVIVDRPIHDLPFMDVLRWQEIAVFVGSGGAGIEGVKRFLRRVDEGRLVRMKRSGVAAAQHFLWNSPPQPFDSFNTVAYQLWLRRHAIRYAESRDWAQS